MKAAKTIAICAGLWLLTSCGKQDVSSAKAAPTDPSPKVQVTKVLAQKLAITVHLPGEIEPYEVVAVFPKVTGFVKSITVDRGSRVKAGERIAQLEAPELIAQRSEAQSKLQAAQAQLAAAEAKVASDEGTYEHLKAAAATPGVAVPMLRIETLSRLRVVVPVPETYAAGVPEGTKVDFTVPAFPGRIFSG